MGVQGLRSLESGLIDIKDANSKRPRSEPKHYMYSYSYGRSTGLYDRYEFFIKACLNEFDKMWSRGEIEVSS